MIDINKNRTSPKKANSIRTNLLLTINKEIISQEKQNKNNNFLINSRNTQTYSNGFDNYVIVERDVITCSQKDYKTLKEKDELPLFLFKMNLQEESPIILNTKKMRIAKNPELKRRSSTKCLLKKKNEDIIESNFKNLRLFCNLLKSKSKVDRKVVNNRNKSQIIRRKKAKFNKVKSSNNLTDLRKCSYFKKNENDNNSDENILILNNISKKKDKRLKKKYEQQSLLTSIKENYLYFSKYKKRIDDTDLF